MTDVDQGYRPSPGMLCGVTGPDGQQRLYLSEINGEKSKVYRLLSLPEQSAAVNGKDGYYYKTKDVARTKRLWDGRKQNEGQEWVGDVWGGGRNRAAARLSRYYIFQCRAGLNTHISKHVQRYSTTPRRQRRPLRRTATEVNRG